MEWPFSRVRKIFFRGRNFRQNPGISAERAIFAKFQAPKFENSEPEKMQFHTPSHSIPPLDSLLSNLLTTHSEKLEKAGTVDFKKYPARKVGTRSWQCWPKVPGRFAFPGAPNPRIRSISRFGKNFPAIFPALSRSFPREPPNRPQKQPQPSGVF